MRNLNECKAEVLRRSENRIKERRKKHSRVLACCISLCLVLVVLAVTIVPSMLTRGNDLTFGGDDPGDGVADGTADDCMGNYDGEVSADNDGDIEDFSFSLTWGCHGVSFYDSKTGMLVKTKDATSPKDYVTTHFLTDTEKRQIYKLVKDLGISSYPDNYDPHNGSIGSDPPMTLILSVRIGVLKKTVKAENIALTYECDDKDGQRFLTACKEIEAILTATDEWNALPEYEFFYY